MPTLQQQGSELFRDRMRLQRLLTLVKRQRGLSDHHLLFVGVSIVAQYYWCAMQSVFKAREDELSSFRQWLAARIYNAYQLELIKVLPESDSILVRIGDTLTLEHVRGLLSKKRAYSMKRTSNSLVKRIPQELLMQLAKEEDSPLARGLLVEEALAEKYETASWGFERDGFVIVGEPDGITDQLVYEFKSTTNLWYMKPVAMAQADLYAYFFRKEIKRVQIYSLNQEKMDTWEESADYPNAEQTLTKFREAVNGALPLAPKAWKCKTCKFVSTCPVKPA